MIYTSSLPTLVVFLFFVAVVLGLSFYLGSRAKSAKGFYAAHGQVNWVVNGVAFAGDYLSAASFLGICGLIATTGYDGFLYSIGFLAGWVVALFVIAEPLKRLGRFTFADALDNRFNSRGIKLSAAISTLVVSVFYLIPQMVGAGALIKPLLGLPYYAGVGIVGGVVIIIVATAGMVSTTWVQFIKGSLLVVFCAILTVMILMRGLTTHPDAPGFTPPRVATMDELLKQPGMTVMEENGPWKGKAYVRLQRIDSLNVQVWRKLNADGTLLGECQKETVVEVEAGTDPVTQQLLKSRTTFYNDVPRDKDHPTSQLRPVGSIYRLPQGADRTASLGPLAFLSTLSDSIVIQWASETIKEGPRVTTTIYFPRLVDGATLLVPGGGMFKGIRPKPGDKPSDLLWARVDFISLMLALFAGTASLPHILIRYYTVKDQASARKSTVVGIAVIGFFYVLTLYLGLAAMTGGVLDPTDAKGNMAAPLLARSFGELPFAVISAIAFTTVLGTVSGLIMAASGAVAHDLLGNVMKMKLDDHQKVQAGKLAAVVVGVIAMGLGIAFEKMNPSFLVGWAFNVAASANLPALVMLLFWRGTTKQGITAAIVVGMLASLAWILLSAQAYRDVYGIDPGRAVVPFSQPGIVTIPLGFAVLVVVSLLTSRSTATRE